MVQEDNNNNTRKPHNYSEEATSAQREEWAKIEAAAAEVKKINEMREAQKTFRIDSIERVKFTPSGNGDAREEQESDEEREEELAAQRLTKSDIDFMFDVMMKEAKHDGLSVRQLFLGKMSTFTKLPIPHVINSRDPGAGKSYLLNHVDSFIPDRYITRLVGSSEKTLFHKDGIMVHEDENHEVKPIQPIIADLQVKVEELQDQIDLQEQLRKEHKTFDAELIRSNRKQIRQTESEIKDLAKSAQKLIDLTDQIITYQDTPPQNMISLIMSLLSQDSPKDQLYTFVEKRNGELAEKKNRLKGTPNLFYTQVIDDTDNQRYEEKNRRFIHITPDTTEEKIDSACELISDTFGLTDEEYEDDVVTEQDKQKACHIVEVIIAKLKQHSKHFKPKKTGVRIPFQRAIVNSIPVDKRDVWRMTAANRVFKYLTMITKINMDQRPKILYTESGKEYIISTFDDVAEVLPLVQRAISKMRPYQEDWFYNVFIPVYQAQNNEVKFAYNELEMKVSETVVGVTTEELATKTAEVLKCSKPSTDQVRKKYLDPLVNIGLVNKHDSRIKLHTNIYSPVDDATVRDKIDKFIVKDVNLFPYKDFLEHSLRRIVTHGEDGPDKIQENGERVVLDHEGIEISVAELVKRYLSGAERVFSL